VRRLLSVLCLAVLAAGCSGLGVRNSDAATVNGTGIPTDRLSEMTKAQLGQQQQAQDQQGQQSQDIDGATRQALASPSRSPTSTPAWSSSSSR